MAEYRLRCFQCQKELSLGHVPGRREDCPSCGADLHVCRNCAHYDRQAYNECRETSADVVREKERANFCDFFTPEFGSLSTAGKDPKQDLMAAAEALFKKK